MFLLEWAVHILIHVRGGGRGPRGWRARVTTGKLGVAVYTKDTAKALRNTTSLSPVSCVQTHLIFAMYLIFAVCTGQGYLARFFAVCSFIKTHGNGIVCRVPRFKTHGKEVGTQQRPVFP